MHAVRERRVVRSCDGVDNPVADIEENVRSGKETARHSIYTSSLLFALRIYNARRLTLVRTILHDVDLQTNVSPSFTPSISTRDRQTAKSCIIHHNVFVHVGEHNTIYAYDMCKLTVYRHTAIQNTLGFK